MPPLRDVPSPVADSAAATLDRPVAEPRDAGSPAPRIGAGDALLIVDLQRDFLPAGRLAVARGDAVVAPANACIERFVAGGLPVFASRDWHPPGHCSFRESGGPWPEHCVAGSDGACFADGLRLPAGAVIVSKGTEPDRDAYSAFGATGLDAHLREAGTRRLFVAGLATDYCVLHTVLDALALGYGVVLIEDGVAAVDVTPGDGARALERMRLAGAATAASHQLA